MGNYAATDYELLYAMQQAAQGQDLFDAPRRAKVVVKDLDGRYALRPLMEADHECPHCAGAKGAGLMG